MRLVATFVSNYVEKASAGVKRKEDRNGPERKVRESLSSPPTSDSTDDDEIPSKDKNAFSAR